jgi:hypothetical protein
MIGVVECICVLHRCGTGLGGGCCWLARRLRHGVQNPNCWVQ